MSFRDVVNCETRPEYPVATDTLLPMSLLTNYDVAIAVESLVRPPAELAIEELRAEVFLENGGVADDGCTGLVVGEHDGYVCCHGRDVGRWRCVVVP